MTHTHALLAALVSALVVAACSREAAPAAPARGRFAMSYAPTETTPADAAIARAQADVRRQPDRAEPYVALATAFIQRSRWGRSPTFLVHAGDALDAARALGGAGVDVATADITLLTEQHRFAEARDASRRLVAAAPGEPTGYLLLGDALLELGDVDGAADAYQRAIDIRPDLRSYERAAHVRWLDGDVDGAIDLLGRALEAGSRRDPEPAAWCTVALGSLLWQRGQLDAAATSAERALALVPEYPGALLLSARVQVARGDAAGALAALDRIPAPVRTVEELALRADALALLGRSTDDVAAEIGRRVRSDPREVARYWARRGREVERARALAAAVADERPTIDALAVLALADARAGRVADARAALARARRLGTPDPRLPLYDAAVALAAGDRTAARRLLAAAPLARTVDPVLVADLERRLAVSP